MKLHEKHTKEELVEMAVKKLGYTTSEARRKTKETLGNELTAAAKTPKKTKTLQKTSPKSPKTPKKTKTLQKTSPKKGCVSRSKIPLQLHQLAIVKYLQTHRGAIVNHSTGTGKTLTAAVASQCFLDRSKENRVIVVAPAGLIENFRKELVAYGVPSQERYEFCSYQIFAKNYKKTPLNSHVMLIIDEAHNFRTSVNKGAKSDTTNRSKVLVDAAKTAGKVLLLTATSVYNEPYDVANAVAMVKGTNPLTRTQFTSILRESSKEEFETYFSCVFSFYDVPKSGDYPRVTEHYVSIPMSREYYRAYRDVEERQSEAFKNSNPWPFLNGMRRASNKIFDCPKCDWVMDHINFGEKTIIYSFFKEYGLNKLREVLRENDIHFVEISGTTPKDKREEALKAYNIGEVNVVLISKAGAEGLDFKYTNNLVIFESSWNRANEEQIIGRAARYKSHEGWPDAQVNVYHLAIAKPPKKMRDKGDDHESADTMMMNLMKEKENVNDLFIKRLRKLGQVGTGRCD